MRYRTIHVWTSICFHLIKKCVFETIKKRLISKNIKHVLMPQIAKYNPKSECITNHGPIQFHRSFGCVGYEWRLSKFQVWGELERIWQLDRETRTGIEIISRVRRLYLIVCQTSVEIVVHRDFC